MHFGFLSMGMAMKLFDKLISFDNLQDAYEKAKLHKMSQEVLEFAANWRVELLLLKSP